MSQVYPQPSLFDGKACGLCRQWQPLLEYTKQAKSSDGLNSRCRACACAYNKSYRESNRQAVLAGQQRWRAANPEAILSGRQRRAEENKRYYAEWITRNRDRMRAHTATHDAHKRNAAGRFTGDEWRGICEAAGGRCLRCGHVRPLTVDHVLPVSKGGSNYAENLQPLCKSCNSAKKDRHIDYRESP